MTEQADVAVVSRGWKVAYRALLIGFPLIALTALVAYLTAPAPAAPYRPLAIPVGALALAGVYYAEHRAKGRPLQAVAIGVYLVLAVVTGAVAAWRYLV